MAAALPGFQSAAELGPSPSREQELEEQCRRIAAENEVLQAIADGPLNDGETKVVERRINALERKSTESAHFTHEDRNKLNELISDLIEQGKEQARIIEDLQNVSKEQSEQIGLLRDGIVRLQKEFDDLGYRVTLDIALDRQRIKKLEFPEQMQPKQKDRADMLRLLLAANNGKMLAKDARHRLGISESQFSQLLKNMKGLVEVRPFHLDGRQNVITLTKALTNDGT